MKFLGFIFVFDSVHFSVILPVYLKIHVIRPLVLSVQVTSCYMLGVLGNMTWCVTMGLLRFLSNATVPVA
jgi:hypothetical protein